jgi:hypothetical protein
VTVNGMNAKIRYGSMAAGSYLRCRYGFEFPTFVPEALLPLTDVVFDTANDLRLQRGQLANAVANLRRDFDLMDSGINGGVAIWHPLGESASDIHPYAWARRIEAQEERFVQLLIVYKQMLKDATA